MGWYARPRLPGIADFKDGLAFPPDTSATHKLENGYKKEIALNHSIIFTSYKMSLIK
jgi:hypothetical protein